MSVMQQWLRDGQDILAGRLDKPIQPMHLRAAHLHIADLESRLELYETEIRKIEDEKKRDRLLAALGAPVAFAGPAVPHTVLSAAPECARG